MERGPDGFELLGLQTLTYAKSKHASSSMLMAGEALPGVEVQWGDTSLESIRRLSAADENGDPVAQRVGNFDPDLET